MSHHTLVSWNINSIRLRIDRVMEFIDRESPDVICFQEIKCREAEFPSAPFADRGFNHIEIAGQKGMHGVATVSKLPLRRTETPPLCREDHARVVSVAVGATHLHNIYLPAGGDEPDAEKNPKFDHKLDFVDRMAQHYGRLAKSSSEDPLVVVGDLNIAPHENDVWSHKQLLKIVSHTPVETDGLDRIIKQGRFTDIARHANPDDQKLYTWWSYRSKDWAASNRGRRLDHIWTNPAALTQTIPDSYKIHLADRGGLKPSDHAPISVQISLSDA